VLITDAPYHKNNKRTKLGLLEVAKKIKLAGIQIYTICVDLERYHWIAHETGGSYNDITGDFRAILDELAVKLTSQYVLRYITSNSAFDNTWRDVEVGVFASEKAKMRYKSASNISVSSMLVEKSRPADAYAADKMIDGKKETAWNEGAIGSGIGEWVRFGFDKPKRIKAIKIIGGYAKTAKIYNANNRVKTLKLHFSDGKTQTVALEDKMDYQTVAVDRDTPTDYIKLEIRDVYKGSRYDDTAISELEFVYAE
jgi:hypothetical protein